VKVDKYHIVYFLGIGGIGMSALARWFNIRQKKVFGYDRTPTALTDRLQQEGMLIHFEDTVDRIPAEVTSDKANALVVYTPAIPGDHQGLNYLKSEGFTVKKRSEVLGMITEGHFTIAVAGTHGKTTITSMIAHILTQNHVSCTAFVGGILQGYESNLISAGRQDQSTRIVVEADEYDRSFLRLQPDMAVVTSNEADHLDIYGDLSSLRSSFRSFVRQIRKDGQLFINAGIAHDFDPDPGVQFATYGIESGQCQAKNIRTESGAFVFDFKHGGHEVKDIKLSIPGYHNVENATAAMSVAAALQVDYSGIKRAIESYKGVKRRFEYIIKNNDLVYIDDYAHHPTEISALLKSVKALFPGKIITAVFQPHLFSRTRDFSDAFANSLSEADEVILMNIYPAREKPIEGVTSEMLLEKITSKDKKIVRDEQLLEELAGRNIDVLLTIGAGNIDRYVQPIQRLLGERRFYA